MPYEVRRLRLLRELAARGTIAATAEACHLTPSAVSQQLALLEREAGTPLLLRDGRCVVLTEAARVLVTHTERVLAELEAAHAALTALEKSVRGTVRLGSFPSAAGSLAAPAIANCQADHPELRVLLDESEPAQGIDAVRRHVYDLALVYEYNLLPRLDDEGVVIQPLLREPLLAALPARDGSLPTSGPVSLTELSGRPWVAPHSDRSLRTVLERACQAAGFRPRLDFASDDYTVIMALVQAGLGVSLIPTLATEPLSAEVRLCEVSDFPLNRTVSLALRRGGEGDPRVAAVVDALSRAVATRES